jgi:membrane protease YdiL (CAAX protease family)
VSETLDRRRIGIFLLVAFGLAWATALVIYVTGGLQDSPMVLPGLGVTLALLLLTGPVMWAPAVAHLLTRLMTGEGWEETRLRPRLKQGWPYWLVAWFLPGLLTVAGTAAFFLLFPRHYDPSLSTLREMLDARLPEGMALEELNLWTLAAVQVVQAMLIAPLINSIATFGEEFGWRGYLQRKLMPLGPRRAWVLTGVIWGVWHWPVILMGYNYGFDYPGAPILGLLAMVWFTVALAILLGWLARRGRSVWPAVIGHAAVNGIAAIGVIFVRGEPNTLLGPTPVGVVGGAGFALAAALILVFPAGVWNQ